MRLSVKGLSRWFSVLAGPLTALSLFSEWLRLCPFVLRRNNYNLFYNWISRRYVNSGTKRRWKSHIIRDYSMFGQLEEVEKVLRYRSKSYSHGYCTSWINSSPNTRKRLSLEAYVPHYAVYKSSLTSLDLQYVLKSLPVYTPNVFVGHHSPGVCQRSVLLFSYAGPVYVSKSFYSLYSKS